MSAILSQSNNKPVGVRKCDQVITEPRVDYCVQTAEFIDQPVNYPRKEPTVLRQSILRALLYQTVCFEIWFAENAIRRRACDF